MANTEQLELLKTNVENWNQWRKKDEWKTKIDLSEVDLARTSLQGVNLYKACLRGAHLQGANLSKADLREADLSQRVISLMTKGLDRQSNRVENLGVPQSFS